MRFPENHIYDRGTRLTTLHSDSGHSGNWTKIFHCPTSSGASDWASERAKEWLVRPNERADERVAHYKHPIFKKFWITVYLWKGWHAPATWWLLSVEPQWGWRKCRCLSPSEWSCTKRKRIRGVGKSWEIRNSMWTTWHDRKVWTKTQNHMSKESSPRQCK